MNKRERGSKKNEGISMEEVEIQLSGKRKEGERRRER